MSDKERSVLTDSESFDGRLHAEGVRLGEADASGIKGRETGRSTGRGRERASDIPVSRFDEKATGAPEGSQDMLPKSSAGQKPPESKRSLVAELASHLGEQRSDFHESKRVIGYCRQRFRAARF